MARRWISFYRVIAIRLFFALSRLLHRELATGAERAVGK